MLEISRTPLLETNELTFSIIELLALYKEVQEYWDSGKLDVPEDVTLLFADDNFGTLRRLPCGDEISRKGGAGVSCQFKYLRNFFH